MGTQPRPPIGGGAPVPNFRPISIVANGWMHEDAIWYGCKPQPRELCVRWRPSPPPQKGGGAPKVSAHVYCGQTVGWIKMPLCVRWGPSPTPRKGGGAPLQFTAHFYCGETAGCIKMPLGMEVGLSPGDFVLDGDPATPSQKGGMEFQDGISRGGRPWSDPHCARWEHSPPPKKGAERPQFSVHLYCGQTAGCIKMPLGMEVGLGLRDIVFDVMWTYLPPEKSAHPPSPNFWPMSIVAKWMDG